MSKVLFHSLVGNSISSKVGEWRTFSLALRGAIAASLLCASLLAQSSSIKVTLLGTSGPSSNLNLSETGTLVQAGNETLLFDCGRGVPERLQQIGALNVNRVFLTHLHSDHTEGLPILWMSGWNGRGANPLSVWGPAEFDPNQPAGTADLTAALANAYLTNTHIRRDLVEMYNPNGITFNTTEIEEGVVYQNNGVTVTAFLVDHSPVDRKRLSNRIYFRALSGDELGG